MISDHDNNAILIAGGLSVTAASLVGLVVVATGRVEWLAYLLPLFFLTLGGSSAWLGVLARRQTVEKREQDDMERALRAGAATARAMAGIPAYMNERDVIRIGGRIVPFYRPADPHEAAWRSALVHFAMHAWRAKAWTVSALVGPAVDSRDDWMMLTDILADHGYVNKKNGQTTQTAKEWTYRKIIRHVQLGESRITFPQQRPPRVRVPEVVAPGIAPEPVHPPA